MLASVAARSCARAGARRCSASQAGIHALPATPRMTATITGVYPRQSSAIAFAPAAISASATSCSCRSGRAEANEPRPSVITRLCGPSRCISWRPRPSNMFSWSAVSHVQGVCLATAMNKAVRPRGHRWSTRQPASSSASTAGRFALCAAYMRADHPSAVCSSTRAPAATSARMAPRPSEMAASMSGVRLPRSVMLGSPPARTSRPAHSSCRLSMATRRALQPSSNTRFTPAPSSKRAVTTSPSPRCAAIMSGSSASVGAAVAAPASRIRYITTCLVL
mmetsp:Transcript_32192/g.102533  ORF Transcript_32192/g.102533 Transcript_32192/m.102533 type:complete len:278 (-) Transcript_32192:548-1381(-)